MIPGFSVFDELASLEILPQESGEGLVSALGGGSHREFPQFLPAGFAITPLKAKEKSLIVNKRGSYLLGLVLVLRYFGHDGLHGLRLLSGCGRSSKQHINGYKH